MIDRKIFKDADALLSLFPQAQWSIVGENVYTEEVDENGNITYSTKNFIWNSDEPLPSKQELETEVARLQEDYDSKEYQRLRQPEYPPLADLADALYWQAQGDDSKMTAYLAAVEAVKQKYPKGV